MTAHSIHEVDEHGTDGTAEAALRSERGAGMVEYVALVAFVVVAAVGALQAFGAGLLPGSGAAALADGRVDVAGVTMVGLTHDDGVIEVRCEERACVFAADTPNGHRPVEHRWAFPDGSTASGRSVTVEFDPRAGVQRVTLAVLDASTGEQIDVDRAFCDTVAGTSSVACTVPGSTPLSPA